MQTSRPSRGSPRVDGAPREPDPAEAPPAPRAQPRGPGACLPARRRRAAGGRSMSPPPYALRPAVSFAPRWRAVAWVTLRGWFREIMHQMSVPEFYPRRKRIEGQGASLAEVSAVLVAPAPEAEAGPALPPPPGPRLPERPPPPQPRPGGTQRCGHFCLRNQNYGGVLG